MLLTKTVTLALSLLVLGLLAVGCGGGDSGSAEGSIDKAAFVSQADAICKKASGRMFAELRALGKGKNLKAGPGGEAETTVVTKVAIPVLEDELEEIRALGIPSEGKPQVEAFLGAMRKMISSAQAAPETFLADASGSYENARLASGQVGMSACPARSSGTS
jgi:hypothetical protein